LEAPDRSKPLLLCQRCFAILPDQAEFCAECGAPAVDEIGEGSDAAVYPELARANLLRMRGEYKLAEDICLSILRKHPNSATANTLLGDICAEKGDLKQAADWYEMALDVTPDSSSDRAKLDSVRRRIKEHETAETAKHLGLPESRPKVGLFVGGVVVFLLGERTNQRRTAARDVTVPVSVPQETSRSEAGAAGTNGDTTSAPVPTELLGMVREALGGEASRVVAASRFPDTFGVLLVFTVTGTEDPRRLGAELARLALEKVSDAPSVTLMAMRSGRIAYSAVAPRERFQATRSEDWKAANAENPAALADAILTEEWPPAAPSEQPLPEGPGEGPAGP
jgi:RNA polymerase subunit RPABC4/transcription elongation factor Spt4